MATTTIDQETLNKAQFALGLTMAARWEHGSLRHGSWRGPRMDCPECVALESAVAAVQAVVDALEGR